jgi:SAM-dependent methyltransferase
MAMGSYVHGYDALANLRLQDQANTLADLLHSDTRYPAGSSVLEAGCGIGAQTVILARNSPNAHFTSIDISRASLQQAAAQVSAAGLSNVTFHEGDILGLAFAPASFDHAFVCFVLEHVAQPVDALRAMRPLVKPGGTITVIEGDHGSTLFHPDDDDARAAVACLVALQRTAGGNANIGRSLYSVVRAAGFQDVQVSPRLVYADDSRPQMVDGFTRRTFTPMVEQIREAAVAAGLIAPDRFDAGIRALLRTTQPDGAFCYTFFKATVRV